MNVLKRLDIIEQFLSNKNVSELEHIFLPYLDKIRFVGGCIRDSLLGLKINDYDLATSLLPGQIIEILESKNKKYFVDGLKHGTVSLVIDSQVFEITTLRIDQNTDGRRAEVTFTDCFEIDSKRRDFTINALSMDFSGNIYDYSTGIKDLELGIVRFIGEAEQRIKEDYLRILRLFRFWIRYGKREIDSEVISCIQKNIKGLNILSGERIKAELEKIITSDKLLEILPFMRESLVLNNLGFEIEINKLLPEIINFEKNNNINTDFIRRLVLLINVSDDNIKLTENRLKLSNKEKKYLHQLTRLESKSFNEILYYHDRTIWEAYAVFNLDSEKLKYIKNLQPKKFILPITASDLINLGIPEGPKIGKIIKYLESEWINSSFSLTKQQLLKYIDTI